jgi:hypothetical protein
MCRLTVEVRTEFKAKQRFEQLMKAYQVLEHLILEILKENRYRLYPPNLMFRQTKDFKREINRTPEGILMKSL